MAPTLARILLHLLHLLSGLALVAADKWPIYYSPVISQDFTKDKRYGVDPGWAANHTLGTHYIGLDSRGESDYAAFKCQYACNGTPGCVSFFVRFVNINQGTDEHCECVEFDARLEPNYFVVDETAIPVGGYNKFH